MQPRRAADMIRMVVRDNDALDRFAAHDSGEMSFPQLVCDCYAITGIDDSPALAVFIGILQQPQIDVVEREGQRHANPVNTGGDKNGFSRCGRYFVRIGDHRESVEVAGCAQDLRRSIFTHSGARRIIYA